MAQAESLGITDVVLCSGARNAPIVRALEEYSLPIYDFFHESEAGFFALGLAKAGRFPLVVCTSGTAVSQALSSCAEAYYDNQFILFATADRPSIYRGTGAPQTMHQTGLFQDFVSYSLDWEKPEDIKSLEIPMDQPLHINLCFDSPLWWGEEESRKEENQSIFLNRKPNSEQRFLPSDLDLDKPLFVLSRLSLKERQLLKSFLKHNAILAYVEKTAGLNQGDFHPDTVLLPFESYLSKSELEKWEVDSVVHFGGVPTCRLWRDLASETLKLTVKSFGRGRFSGLPQVSRQRLTSDALLALEPKYTLKIDSARLRDINEKKKLFSLLLEKYPRSELGLYYQLSQKIKKEDFVYSANSSSVRHLDLLPFFSDSPISVNRGLNGIDGQISSLLGEFEASDKSRAIGFYGDLSFLYSQSGLWASKFLKDHKAVHLFVLNNNGGRIFDKFFPKNPFQNPHEIALQGFCKAYGADYQLGLPDNLEDNNARLKIYELIPREQESKEFQKEWNELWQ